MRDVLRRIDWRFDAITGGMKMVDEQSRFEIRFQGLSVAEAGIKAAKLRKEISALDPNLNVSLQKDDPTTQDFGTTLVLILGAPAVIKLASGVASGIASFLQRDRGKISIWADGTLIAENISGRDAEKIASAFAKRRG